MNLTTESLVQIAQGVNRLPPAARAAVVDLTDKMARKPSRAGEYLSKPAAALLINVLDLTGGFWTPLEVDRPVIVRTITVNPITAGGLEPTSAQVIGPCGFWYAPELIPKDVAHAQLNAQGGVVYLPTPGRWWIMPTLLTRRQTVLVLDAQNPLVAAFYLSLPGVTSIPAASNLQIPQTAGTLLAHNTNRIAFAMQNLSATTNARYRVAQGGAGWLSNLDPVGSATVSLRRGFRLLAGGEAVFIGDVSSQGWVRFLREDGSAVSADDRCEAWEFQFG